MALGAMKAIRDLGYGIPEDFSVTGFDGIPIAEYTTPGLTTVEQDVSMMGYSAAALLQELRRDQSKSKRIYVPYRLQKKRQRQEAAKRLTFIYGGALHSGA